jgi:hypothetical protein
MSCASCRFSAPKLLDDDAPVLECRRFPPTVLVLDATVVQLWPQMSAEDGCGEYERQRSITPPLGGGG